jgi:hypothetical protein
MTRGEMLKRVQHDVEGIELAHKVILNLFNFVQFAHALHSSSKLVSALAQSQISASVRGE